MHPRLRAAATVLVAAGATLLTTVPATADVAPAYGSGATATRLSGTAFDTCQAPSLDALAAWRGDSSYRGVGIYSSGRNRFCDEQPLLTPSYVTQAGRSGWKFIPIHVGRQAPCTTRSWVKINRYTPYDNGVAEADEATEAVRALGMLSGTAIYLDIEHYSTNDPACTATVLRFVDGWVDRLHQRGMLAGVYSSGSSGISDLVEAYDDPAHSRPDAIWFAHWDGKKTVWDSPYVPNSAWRSYQRLKQYQGDHDETHGGVTLNIDSNQVAGIFASIRFRYTATSSTALNVRRGPKTTEPVIRQIAPGATVEVACQTPGQLVGSTRVWNRLTGGGWVTDAHVSTPSSTTYSYPLPRCSTPFQAVSDVWRRTGPSLGYSNVAVLTKGSLAHVECQKTGQLVAGRTRVWNRLVDGSWVTDAYLRSRSSTGFSSPAPRC